MEPHLQPALQPIAELDQAGNWTDYIYANGQKIARTTSTYQRLHLNASSCGAGGWAVWNVAANNYPVGTGDKVVWQENHADGQQSLLMIQFANNSWTTVGNRGRG